jgi:methenyltetrahydromethanopterin cyclohydrolase
MRNDARLLPRLPIATSAALEDDPRMFLNERAWELCDRWCAIGTPDSQVEVISMPSGTRVIDCGVKAAGGRSAGVMMAEICLSGLGRVSVKNLGPSVWAGPWVWVFTEEPVAACMASQYAGWQIAGERFFAMGSGPMRAAYGKEKLFDDIGFRERPSRAVGVLETTKLPPDEVCRKIAADCGVPADKLMLVCAKTASDAGHLQIAARSVETALHKMHELGFDLHRVKTGQGFAPLPPTAPDDMKGIGRTNDAVLYGGVVMLSVVGDDESLAEIGPQIPSSSSRDFGEPFATIFERYNRDFYRIDPLLFSPAVVQLVNLDTGRCHAFGQLRPDVLKKSFNAGDSSTG